MKNSYRHILPGPRPQGLQDKDEDDQRKKRRVRVACNNCRTRKVSVRLLASNAAAFPLLIMYTYFSVMAKDQYVGVASQITSPASILTLMLSMTRL